MRQQYHIREVDGHTLIWDVHKLVKNAQDLPIKQILLVDIKELNEPYWFKHSDVVTANDFIHHARLVDEASLDFPIILCAEGRLMDGMHRVVKAVLLGYGSISAVQFSEKIQPDYVDVDLDSLPYDD